MTPERALRTLLLADTAVAALVGDRIYPPGELPQKPTLPALVYQRISDVDGLTNDGLTGPQRPRVQVDAYARTQLEVEDLDDAARAALHGKQWAVGADVVLLVERAGGRDLPPDAALNPEPGVRLKRRSSDYFVHFRKAA